MLSLFTAKLQSLAQSALGPFRSATSFQSARARPATSDHCMFGQVSGVSLSLQSKWRARTHSSKHRLALCVLTCPTDQVQPKTMRLVDHPQRLCTVHGLVIEPKGVGRLSIEELGVPEPNTNPLQFPRELPAIESARSRVLGLRTQHWRSPPPLFHPGHPTHLSTSSMSFSLSARGSACEMTMTFQSSSPWSIRA